MQLVRSLRILIFAAALIAPLTTMQGGSGMLSNEQRARLARPHLAVAGRRFPEEFDAYFKDNFGWRERLIRWHHLFKFRYLGESPVSNVIVGRDDWLFYAAEGDGIDIRDFSGRWPHTAETVDGWLRQQDQRRIEYARDGARYLVALVPNKQTVYPGQMPWRYGPHASGAFDSVMRQAARYPELEILDLRRKLSEPGAAAVFYKADSHWNANGAFAAAQAIVDRLRVHVPRLGPLRREDYTITGRSIDSGDLVNMLALGIGIDDLAFTYERRPPGAANVKNEDLHRVWEHQDRSLPRAILLGDSFGGELAPRLADAVSTLHYYYSMRGGRDPELVHRERPDVVVLVLVERYLPHLESQ